MTQLSVVPVTTKSQQKQFLELPWKIYRDYPMWVPPIRMDQKEMVGYAKHPFYLENEGQTFLALRGSEPVGRISAIVNNAHNERFNEKRGFFGFFESIEEQAVASALFETAENWLRERGMTHVRGPVSYTHLTLPTICSV